MSSPNPTSSSNTPAKQPSNPHPDFGTLPPFWKLAAEVPDYHAWVAAGGLKEFAGKYGLDSNFIDHFWKIPPAAMFAFHDKLYELPAVKAHLDAVYATRVRIPMDPDVAFQMMVEIEEGPSGSEDEDDSENDDQGTKSVREASPPKEPTEKKVTP